MIVISIPVKTHVKKYLQKRYGTVHTITKKSFIGLFLLNILEKKIEKPTLDHVTNDKYELTIPESYFSTKGFTIPQSKLKFISICLERLFLEDFYNAIDIDMQKANPNAMQSIKFFLKYYNISENELKLESMYRNYQRYSDEKITEKKKKNTLVV